MGWDNARNEQRWTFSVVLHCRHTFLLSLTVYVANTYGINVGLSDKTLKGRRRPDLLRSRLGISCWEKLRRCDSRELIPFLHCNCLQLLDTAAGVGFGWRSFWRLVLALSPTKWYQECWYWKTLQYFQYIGVEKQCFPRLPSYIVQKSYSI